MTDARWFEVDADIEAAIRHFRTAVFLYQKGGFDAPGLDGYQAEMATDACAAIGTYVA